MHERRGDYDQAWMCYDQAQTHFPEIEIRNQFKHRMESRMDGGASLPWKQPGVSSRIEFLRRMQSLAKPNTDKISDLQGDFNEEEVTNNPLEEVSLLMGEKRFSEAFFLARRMAAEGVEGAIEMMESIMEELE